MSHWGRSWLEEPIRWSRWARLKAWWYGYELPRTPMDAFRMHTKGISEMVSAGSSRKT